jgi:hypothetical protein
MADDINLLREEIRILRNQVERLCVSVAEIQEKSRAKNKKDLSNKIELTIHKQDFIDSNPEERTDPFTNFELVFWASYILRKTSRREKIDTYAEIGKRVKRIKEVIKFFVDSPNLSEIDETEKENHARRMTKDFLEYVLTEIPEYKKGTEMVPMTFWPAVSDWSISNNISKMLQWQRDRKLDKYDVPLEDDD